MFGSCQGGSADCVAKAARGNRGKNAAREELSRRRKEKGTDRVGQRKEEQGGGRDDIDGNGAEEGVEQDQSR